MKLPALALLLSVSVSPSLAAAQDLALELVVSGLSRPVAVTAPANDDRLFVVEQHSAQIRIVRGGEIEPAPFLDLGGQVSLSGEQGLLGLAFDPEFDQNGWFFVNYTDVAGGTRVERYQVSADPDLADASSAQLVLSQPQPFVNHNGGDLHFGPIDGMLYVGFGDGGGAGDPDCNAQDPQTWLGKMLRIDVSQGLPYTVPPSNPYVGSSAVLPEIWASGLRNPWRFSFDRTTGDLYIGDVGQGTREEISYARSLSGGLNFGWKVLEGFICFGDDGCAQVPAPCQAPTYTDPIHEYSHVGFFGPCAVIGGVVYRGCALPDLHGTYFLADHCSGAVWSFRYDGNSVSDYANRTAELQPPGGVLGSISSFGEDASGEVYMTTIAGELFRIVPGPGAGPAVDCNADGLDDACQIALDATLDLDGNSELDTCQALSADVGSLSVAAGGSQTLSLHASAAQGGSVFLTAGSVSGTNPGFVYDGFAIPLNPDAYLLLSTGNPNLAPLTNSFGVLDSQGKATTVFSAPPATLPAALIGTTAAHAYVLLDSAFTVQFASNAVTVALLP